MRSNHLSEALIAATSPEAVAHVMKRFEGAAELAAIIDLYESIWRMTYANASDDDIVAINQADLATKIALMNEQKDLVPHPLTSIETLDYLDLGGFPEAVFFPELLRYTNLKRLDLWENDLSELPPDLFQLNTLESLYVCDKLQALSPLIEQLSHLKHLNLSGNQLNTLPSQLDTLYQLESLELANNKIESFTLNLDKLPKLRKIDLRFNASKLLITPEVLSMCQTRSIDLHY